MTIGPSVGSFSVVESRVFKFEEKPLRTVDDQLGTTVGTTEGLPYKDASAAIRFAKPSELPMFDP